MAGRAADHAMGAAAERAHRDPALQNVILARRFRLNGIDKTLSEVAANAPVFRVDEWTELISTVAEYGVLRFTYRLDPVPDELFPANERELIDANCVEPVSVIILRAGAVIEHVYQDSEMAPLGKVRVTLRDCSEPA